MYVYRQRSSRFCCKNTELYVKMYSLIVTTFCSPLLAALSVSLDTANFSQFIFQGKSEDKSQAPNHTSGVGQDTQTEDEDEDVRIIVEHESKRKSEGKNTKESRMSRSHDSVPAQSVNRRAARKTGTRKKRRHAAWKSDSDEEEEKRVGQGSEEDQVASSEEKRPRRGRPTRRRKRRRFDWREEDDGGTESNEDTPSTNTPSTIKPKQNRRVEDEKGDARSQKIQRRPPKGKAKSEAGGTRHPARRRRAETIKGWHARPFEDLSVSDEEETGLDKNSEVNPSPQSSKGQLDILKFYAHTNSS